MNGPSRQHEGPIHSFLSPEAVRFDLPVSGPAPRILAYGIDAVLIAVLIFFLVLTVSMTLPIGAAIDKWLKGVAENAARQAQHPSASPSLGLNGLVLAIFLISEFVVETGYFIFWELITNGRSPGKMAVGLRVVRETGAPLDLPASTVRNLMRIVDMLPAEYLTGLVSMLVSTSGQRIGDHVAGTIVIRLDRPEAAADIPLEGAMPLVLTRDQLGRFGPQEIQLIRGALRRASGSQTERNQALLAEVAETMRARLGLPEPVDGNDAAFLRGLLAAAERFSRGR